MDIDDMQKTEKPPTRRWHMVHADFNGLHVGGVPFIGSTSDTTAATLHEWLRIAEVWWRTYVDRGCGDNPRDASDASVLRQSVETALDGVFEDGVDGVLRITQEAVDTLRKALRY